MIRQFACLAAACALAIAPAMAADPPGRSQVYIESRTADRWTASPYYVVDHGPVLSGPGIMIVEIGLTNTDLRRSYPFIGSSGPRLRFAPRPDYYGVYPSHVYTAPSVHRRGRRGRVKTLPLK